MNFRYYCLPIIATCLTCFGNAYAVDIKDIDPYKTNNESSLQPTNPQPTEENPAEKIKITDIVINGTARKESVLIAMFLKPGDTATPAQIREDLQRIYGLGYFMDVQAAKETDIDGYKLIVNVVENPILNDVKIYGNNIVKTEAIASKFELQKGKVINLNNLKESIENARKIYGDQGYQAVSIEPQLSPDGSLTININEGIIEDIKIVGALETKPFVIMREIRQKPGDVFNIDVMREDLRRVYNTNFFENVDIKPSAGKKNPNHINIDIVVKEKSTGNINLGAGYNTRDGVIGTFAVTKDNVFGTGQRVGLDLQLGAGWLSQTSSGANWLGKLDWNEPWFLPDLLGPRTGVGVSVYRQRMGNFFQTVNQFTTDLTGGGNAFYNYTLINDRTGASLSFNRALFGDPLTSPWRFALSVRGEQIAPTVPRVQDVGVKIGEVNKSYSDLETSTNATDKSNAVKIKQEFDKYVNSSIVNNLTVSKKGFDNRLALNGQISYDTRDFAADPHDGWNNVMSIEPSVGDVNYWKYFLTANKYTPVPIPFLDKVTFAVGGRLGMLWGDPSKISIYERFFSGGFDTIRGWPENGYLSGENVFVGSAELRFPIYNIVSGVLFFDAGNFWDQNWKVTNANVADRKVNGVLVNQNLIVPFLRYGFGVGLRLNTPLGALRADYGIRDITKPFDLTNGAQFHFNIGQKF